MPEFLMCICDIFVNVTVLRGTRWGDTLKLVPKFPRSEVPKFPSSQVPGTSSSQFQFPGTSSSEI